ncbi:hypothetical protein Alches_17480 [Alicyclobacillus hesperidum subsp. aegles]|uniref:hypothetical protein n=1 Tax=Alicyclobacillus hesperidum TaxID=89784 RepID=UPI00222C082E|nr:hypothetical protein [Alicyclobacillus hesperidum]GLG01708.1 hypothetical protein Alches_17480 [Alicyclobacillus hesperidum subsp. aegles]
MITITIDNPIVENAAIVALANAIQGTQSSTATVKTLTDQSTAHQTAQIVADKAMQNLRAKAPAADSTQTTQTRGRRRADVEHMDSDAAEEEVEQGTAQQPETEVDTPAAPESSGDIPSVVELRAVAQTKGATPEGKKAIKELLNEFGSRSISEVPEDKRADFLARLEAL